MTLTAKRSFRIDKNKLDIFMEDDNPLNPIKRIKNYMDQNGTLCKIWDKSIQPFYRDDETYTLTYTNYNFK